MNFLDYLIKCGELKSDQRECLIEYLDFELFDTLVDLNIVPKRRLDLRWIEYKKKGN